MGSLIIVAGASGAGKTFLLENARKIGKDVISIRKLTTRKARDYETPDSHDLVYEKSKEEVHACDYHYAYTTKQNAYLYGIKKSDIDSALKNNKNPIVIVRSCDTISEIRRDYPDCLVIYLQSILSGEDLHKKLTELGRNDIDPNDRRERIEKDLKDYIKHCQGDLFDKIVINAYEPEDVIEQLNAIIYKHAKSKEKTDKGHIFVLMSFNKKNDKSYKAIENASKMVSHAEFRITRIDQHKGDYKITEKIIENIKNSELIICDLTDERPNVYWELGYARGIGKKVITIAKSGTKIHFDIKDFNTNFYNSEFELQDIIELELETHLKERS